MAAISQVIPNLLGGVSQQPDPLKLPGQVREAENVLLDPTFGCRKRPPTQFIASLATDIPEDAKWFPIMRDENERYVVAIYRNSVPATVIRVWEADTGTERSVTITADSVAYLDALNPRDYAELTINDYTLISNRTKHVTMSSEGIESDLTPEALVVINQVAYNTTYAIDFLKDGDSLTPEKVYKASKISVSPGSFTDENDDTCSGAGSQSFTESSGSKTGLGFTLTVNCSPTLVTGSNSGSSYPTQVQMEIDYPQNFWVGAFGSADNHAQGSYLYQEITTINTNLTVKAEVRVNAKFSGGGNRYDLSSVSIVSYNTNKPKPWAVGDGGSFSQNGATAVITATQVSSSQSTPSYTYKSSYTVSARLDNGGQNWRVGDSVTVSLNGRSYTVKVEEENYGYSYASEAQVSYTSPLDQSQGTLDVGGIVGSLVTSINALDNYVATPVGNVIHIKRTDGKDFNIQTRGGTTNNALYGIKGSVNDVSLLPTQCVSDVVLLVRNSAESDADDYYVKFKPASGDIPGQGAWEETYKPGIAVQLNTSTMPHVLIREANGNFTFRPLSPEYDEALYWAPREVGDEKTNPDPSFVGNRIRDMFFYMNRLGLLTEDSVVLSQPGDYFNFFVGSAIAVSDADPIDMTASSTRPATLKAAIGTSKGLLLFAENSQFLMSTNEAAFGPSTVKLTELSNYSYSSGVTPLETGVSVMFCTEADTYTKVYEMAVDSADNRPLVSENTRICPEYIPPDLTTSATSPNNSLVLYGNDSKTLWTFKFFNTGNERSLAGWAKWVFPAPINLIAFDHDTGYLVSNNEGNHVLLKMEMLDDPKTSPIVAFGSKFTPRLDHSLFKSQVTIEDGIGTDKILRFPSGAYVPGTNPCVILTINGNSTLYRSPPIQLDGTGYYIAVGDDIASTDFIVGLEYDMKVQLPSFFVASEKRPDRKNIPIVENVYIDVFYSGRYEVDLKRLGYDDRVIDLDVTDADIYYANDAAIEEVASSVVPVYSRGDQTFVTIRSPDPLPSAVTSYRWEGHYNTRGISIIQ